MNSVYLQNHLNNFVGEGYGFIPRWALRIYGNEEWIEIRKAISEWEDAGWVEILKDPKSCDDNDLCLKMLNFVGATEPMPKNWINYDKKPPEGPVYQ
jgi:hypothetical protein